MNKELPRLMALKLHSVNGVYPPQRRNACFFLVNKQKDEKIILEHAKTVVNFQSEKIVFGGKNAEFWKQQFETVLEEKEQVKKGTKLIAYEDMGGLTQEIIEWFQKDNETEGCLIYDDREAYEDVIEVILQHVKF